MLPVVDYGRMKRVYGDPTDTPPMRWLPQMTWGSLICLGIIAVGVLVLFKRFVDTRRKYASSELESPMI